MTEDKRSSLTADDSRGTAFELGDEVSFWAGARHVSGVIIPTPDGYEDNMWSVFILTSLNEGFYCDISILKVEKKHERKSSPLEHQTHSGGLFERMVYAKKGSH